ncbi:MAG: preprotein translocase subunit YidC [Parcubacteria group bacterium Licking1014_17]|nr:MAG: preprotein translocase subunit YidC [Parcubacteria group bacterium Licking1014_17]
MIQIFNLIIYKPIFNALIAIYNFIPGHDLGLAIILLTIIIRLIFLPLTIRTVASQQLMAKIQPKLKELKERYKDNKQALGEATMALYKEHKINPLSGCLPLLIQFPVLIALYRVFLAVFKPQDLPSMLYSFISNPGVITPIAFGFFDLSKRSIVLAIVAGVMQFIQARSSFSLQKSSGSMDKDSFASKMNKQMMYFFPFTIILIAWGLPAGITIYWIVTTLYSYVEQKLVYKYRVSKEAIN